MMEKIWLKHYDEGVPHEIEIPETTFYEILVENAEDYGERPALSFLGKEMSYSELREAVDRFSSALHQLGVEKGTRVAIMLPNIPQYLIVHYAILKLGAIAVPTNPLYVEREIKYQMNDSEAEILIVLDFLFKRIKNIWSETGLRAVIVTGIKEYLPGHLRILYPLKARKDGTHTKIKEEDNVLFFQRLMKQDYPPVTPANIGPEDIAMFLYTGGTTGLSKAAVLTHKNIISNVRQMRAWMTDCNDGNENVLSVLPFFHSYGLTTCMHFSLVTKSNAVLIPRFDAKTVLKAIQKNKCSMFPGVPTMYIAINGYPDVAKYNLDSVKACISGAAPLPGEVQREFERITGGRLVEGYGLSEASPASHSNPLNGLRKEGSIGIPFPQTSAKIVEPETHEELPVGGIGELAISGPQVMKEYWKRPDETAQVLLDGWLYTGDMARMDEDGYFYIVDRKKDMIIAGGFNIYPRDIEEVLFEHPKIKEAVVAGVPDSYRGETVKAYIVLKEGETATSEEIIDFCKEKLAKFKVPKFVEFREELPKSQIGKVLRRVLVEEEKKKLAEM